MRTDWFHGAEGGKICPTAAPQRPSKTLAWTLEAAGGLGLAVVVVTGPGEQPLVTHAPPAQPIGQAVSVNG